MPINVIENRKGNQEWNGYWQLWAHKTQDTHRQNKNEIHTNNNKKGKQNKKQTNKAKHNTENKNNKSNTSH